MDAGVKQGIVLIVIGCLISLISLPFLSGFNKDAKFMDNFYSIGIPITKEQPAPAAPASVPPAPVKLDNSSAPKKIDWSYVIPTKVPFRIIFALTVFFCFLGYIRIDLAKRRQKGLSEQPIDPPAEQTSNKQK